MTIDEQKNLEEIALAYRSNHDVQWLIEKLAAVTAERDAGAERIGALEAALTEAAAFWRPVARDMEHGVLSIDSVRFLAQDFLTMLAAAATPAAEALGAEGS